MNHQTLTPTSTSTIVLQELGPLLQVRRAISEGDDAALTRLLAVAEDRTRINELIRDVVGYQLKEVRRGIGRVPEHSLLWMVPIVTAPGCHLARRVLPEMNEWVRTWFRGTQSVTTLGTLLHYGEAASLSPGKLQRLIETLARMRVSSFAMLQGDLFHSTEPVWQVPSLQFLVGTTTQSWEPPTFLECPKRDRHALRDRLIGALQFEAGEETPPPVAYSLGRPSAFCDAIVEGLAMWLREVNIYCHVEHWSADPSGGGALDLSMTVQPNVGDALRLVLQMQDWQLGEDGLQALLASCSWPMAPSSPEKSSRTTQ